RGWPCGWGERLVGRRVRRGNLCHEPSLGPVNGAGGRERVKKLHPLPIVALTCVVSIGVSRAGDDNVAMKSGLPGIDPANPGVPTFAYYKPPYNLPRVPLRDVDVAHSTFKRGHGMS